jgi:hypothetical protein
LRRISRRFRVHLDEILESCKHRDQGTVGLSSRLGC